MKGDPDTKHLVKEIYVYSDGSERVIEIKPNPNAEEIVKAVEEAKAEIAEVVVEEKVVAEEAPKKKKAKKEVE